MELHQFRKESSYDGVLFPVQYEFDWTNHFRVRLRKRKCGWTAGWTDKRTKNGQTKGWHYTNFERNLAMMLIYVPVMYEFDWTNRFRVTVQKQKCEQTDGWRDKRTDGISSLSKGT